MPIAPLTPTNRRPPREIVKAIRFLRQEHLPGSLLSEWQFPLPSLEAFIDPFCPSEEVDDIDGISASNTLGVENQQPVNETMLNHLRTFFQQSQGVNRSLPAPSPAIGVTDGHIGLRRDAAQIDKMRNDPLDVHEAGTSRTASHAPVETSAAIPKVDPPTCTKVKCEAERLWMIHKFNFDIYTTQDFLNTAVTTLYHAGVQPELYKLWKHDITKDLLRQEKLHTNFGQPDSLRLLYASHTMSARLQHVYESITGSGNPDQSDRRGTKSAVKMTQDTHRQKAAGKTYMRSESNSGFGATTIVVPFKEDRGRIFGYTGNGAHEWGYQDCYNDRRGGHHAVAGQET